MIEQVIRSLARRPSFALGVVVTLALGIASVALAVAAVGGVLLAPLPHADGSRLVYLRQAAPRAGVENALFSVPEIQVYRDNVDAFQGVAEFSAMRMTALGLDQPRQMHVGIVTGNYFRVLGLEPVLGRLLGPGDDGEASAPVAVLTHEYWHSVYGADPEALGSTLRLNGRTVTIVGVSERHPPYPERTDLFVNVATSPHHASAAMVHGWTHRMTEVFARLEAPATLEDARTQVQTVFQQLSRDYPEAYDASLGYAVEITTLADQLTRRARTILLIVLATAGCVLLVAMANVTNLVLVRSTRLAGELSLRAALGAGAGALRTRLLAENLLLGVLAASLGIGLAVLARPMMVAYLSRLTIRATEIRIGATTVVLAFALALAAALVLSFLPRLPGGAGRPLLRSPGRGVVGVGARRAQRALVATQIAASMVLVFGAGLLARSLVSLQSIDRGMDVTGVVGMDLSAVYNGRSREEIRDDYLEMVAAVEAEPGVERAAITNVLPFRVGSAVLPFRFDFLLDGAEAEPGREPQRADFRTVSDGFFRTLGVEPVAGRDLASGDDASAPLVAVVNEAFAQTYLAGRDPVGHQVAWTGDVVDFAGVSGDERTIVGVMPDVLDDERGTRTFPAIYVPHLQEAWGSALMVRGRGDPGDIGARAAAAVRRVEPDQPVEGITSLTDARRASLGDARLNARLVGLLAVLSMVIAGVGVFAAMAFSVSQRTREMGVRLALGADRRRLVRSVVREGLTTAAVGLAVGVLGSLALGRLLGSLLFGVAPTDLATLAFGAGTLLSAALLASWAPARRAGRVDPVAALGSE